MTTTRAQRLLGEALRGLPEQDVDELRAISVIRLDRLAAVYGGLLDDPDPSDSTPSGRRNGDG